MSVVLCFGFILGADVFDLSSENILAVMIGGAACGMTILLYWARKRGFFVSRYPRALLVRSSRAARALLPEGPGASERR